MARGWTIGAVLLAAAAVGGCGSSSSSSEPKASSSSSSSTSSSSTTSSTRYPPVSAEPQPAGVDPSVESVMVCSEEARGDIADALSVDAKQVTTPTWVDHVYSCDYVYPKGVVTLSVKELSSVAETTAYFDELGRTLGREMTLNLGEGAFHTSDGGLVVRKDYKILLVDVSDAPEQFGKFRLPATAVALNVGETIMGCWTGA